MNSRLGLFRAAICRASRANADCKRKLYTDPIYPYPHHHMATKVYPSRYFYRENFLPNKDDIWDEKELWVLSRAFWAYIWYHIFKHREAYLGHFPSDIDPTKWTDEQLGIPPLEEGSYYDWYEKNRIEDSPQN